ncbi:MAG TPA: septal ring lytic transglycosylase RlpA family protein [Candidatus Methylomirabilis sp.]|nr:septal ring lytic transglycosylase RlpA family protein [Candidatus Methylomirabilis sp.]
MTRRLPHPAFPHTWGLLGSALLALFLASCARPSVRPVSLGTSETGLASWYGPDFHGRRTSSGEIYDMYQLTAAHRELPLGTWVMVTNLNDGRSVEVRVNDRGPFVADRILDMSYAAGRMLGMIGPGVIPVRMVVTRLPLNDRGEPVEQVVRYTVQVGSFISEENARTLEQSLAAIPGVEVVPSVIGGDTYFRVRVGNFARRQDAVAMAGRLAGRGLSVVIMESDRQPGRDP